MDENDWNKLMADWASELNQLEMKLEECNPKKQSSIQPFEPTNGILQPVA